MENTITFGEIPDHKASFLIGVLVGMEIPYEISPESPLYRTLREHQKQIYIEMETEKQKRLLDGDLNFILLTGAGKDDTTVTYV